MWWDTTVRRVSVRATTMTGARGLGQGAHWNGPAPSLPGTTGSPSATRLPSSSPPSTSGCDGHIRNTPRTTRRGARALRCSCTSSCAWPPTTGLWRSAPRRCGSCRICARSSRPGACCVGTTATAATGRSAERAGRGRPHRQPVLLRAARTGCGWIPRSSATRYSPTGSRNWTWRTPRFPATVTSTRSSAGALPSTCFGHILDFLGKRR